MTSQEPSNEERLFDVADVVPIPVLSVNHPELIAARTRASDIYGRTSAVHARKSVAHAIADNLTAPEELIGGLSHSDELVRSRAVSRLVARAPDDQRTLPAILDQLARERDPYVRLVIVQELRVYDRDEAIAALRRATHDEDADVAEAASSSLTILSSLPQMTISPTAGAFQLLLDAEELERAPGTFDVNLVATGPSTIQCVKVLRDLTGLGIADALRAYNRAPQLILIGVNREAAEDAMRRLADVGATAQAVARSTSRC